MDEKSHLPDLRPFRRFSNPSDNTNHFESTARYLSNMTAIQQESTRATDSIQKLYSITDPSEHSEAEDCAHISCVLHRTLSKLEVLENRQRSLEESMFARQEKDKAAFALFVQTLQSLSMIQTSLSECQKQFMEFVSKELASSKETVSQLLIKEQESQRRILDLENKMNKVISELSQLRTSASNNSRSSHIKPEDQPGAQMECHPVQALPYPPDDDSIVGSPLLGRLSPTESFSPSSRPQSSCGLSPHALDNTIPAYVASQDSGSEAVAALMKSSGYNPKEETHRHVDSQKYRMPFPYHGEATEETVHGRYMNGQPPSNSFAASCPGRDNTSHRQVSYFPGIWEPPSQGGTASLSGSSCTAATPGSQEEFRGFYSGGY